MDLFRMRATLLLCRGLRMRAARSSINWVDVSDIHWGRGGRVSGGGVRLRAFKYWNLLSESLNYSGAGRNRGKEWRPQS